MHDVEHQIFRGKKNLQRTEKERDSSLSRITGGETWVHYYFPLTKEHSMERQHESSPRKKITQDADVWG